MRTYRGSTASRLAFLVLLVATLPLGAAAYLARSLFKQASAVWFRPEVGEELDHGVEAHRAWVAAKKTDFRHLAVGAAEDAQLRAFLTRLEEAPPATAPSVAAQRLTVRATPVEVEAPTRNSISPSEEVRAIEDRLRALLARSPEILRYDVHLVGLGDDNSPSVTVASAARATPMNEATERSFTQQVPLFALTKPKAGHPTLSVGELELVATFTVPRENLDALERAATVIDGYHRMESQRESLYSAYLTAFVILLLGTSILTVPLGLLVARGVVRRIERLAKALKVVASGDLSVRVPETGTDEITELSQAFNRMLGEVESSRRKIEFLQRIGAWQEMAKRLAHEIKNPLTPILLAVQECHRKYDGDDIRFRRLLNTTNEIVEEEVGTLRRLVGNFSNFAQLPQVELQDDDLQQFLSDGARLGDRDGVVVEKPTEPLPVAMDRQLLRRVLVNLVENGIQAAEGAGHEPVVHVSARGLTTLGGSSCVALWVEDNGPGVPVADRERIFEPYVTGKSTGTGLGLAIAMKIVVEHEGTLTIDESPSLKGARFALRLPLREV